MARRRKNPSAPLGYMGWAIPKKMLASLTRNIAEAGWPHHQISSYQHEQKSNQYLIEVLLFVAGGNLIFGEMSIEVRGTSPEEVVKKMGRAVENAASRYKPTIYETPKKINGKKNNGKKRLRRR